MKNISFILIRSMIIFFCSIIFIAGSMYTYNYFFNSPKDIYIQKMAEECYYQVKSSNNKYEKYQYASFYVNKVSNNTLEEDTFIRIVNKCVKLNN